MSSSDIEFRFKIAEKFPKFLPFDESLNHLDHVDPSLPLYKLPLIFEIFGKTNMMNFRTISCTKMKQKLTESSIFWRKNGFIK